MKLTYPAVRAVVKGILASENQTKQDLGRRFAFFLGFVPGPRGPDDGVDGVIIKPDKKIHFQSKLSRNPLDKDEARKYFSDINYHRVNDSIMLAGKGYNDGFRERLFGQQGIENVNIHLLTLADLFGDGDAYIKALDDLPELSRLDEINWESFN